MRDVKFLSKREIEILGQKIITLNEAFITSPRLERLQFSQLDVRTYVLILKVFIRVEILELKFMTLKLNAAFVTSLVLEELNISEFH